MMYSRAVCDDSEAAETEEARLDGAGAGCCSSEAIFSEMNG